LQLINIVAEEQEEKKENVVVRRRVKRNLVLESLF